MGTTQLITLGLEIHETEASHEIHSGGGNVYTLPLSSLEAVELIPDCIHYLMSDDVPQEVVDSLDLHNRLHDALTDDDPQVLKDLEKEILNHFADE